MALSLRAAWELHALMEGRERPPAWVFLASAAAVVAAGWPAHQGWTGEPKAPWRGIQTALTCVLLLAFLWEMAWFRKPDGAVTRIAHLFFCTAYAGLLPAYFCQLRWIPDVGLAAMALAVFVPKLGDVFAYLTGKFLGRHPMTPVLSPRKTWEGLIGGLAGSVLASVLICHWASVSPAGGAVAFGLALGLAGVLGDLAESLIKRDCGRKDASGAVPGFGGVLDVIDSVLFAAPLAYWWLRPWASSGS
jgi:phosphatidate cytidylyltransferase